MSVYLKLVLLDWLLTGIHTLQVKCVTYVFMHSGWDICTLESMKKLALYLWYWCEVCTYHCSFFLI